jgi:DHA1 family multidrug resistance protein-like MFS transporter
MAMMNGRGVEPVPWRTLCPLLLAMFAISLGYGIVLPILPFLIERLAGTTDPSIVAQHTGFLTAIYALGLFAMASRWGRFSDHRGRRPLLLLGLIGFAATLAVFAFEDGMLQLYLGRGMSGLFASAVAPAAYALIADEARSKERRARGFLLLNIASMAGFLVGPMLGGFILRAISELFPATDETVVLRGILLATAGFALVAAMIVWRLVPAGLRPTVDRSATCDVQDRRMMTARLLVISFITAMAVGAFEVGLVLRSKQVLGMDAFQIGMMFTECSLVMFVAQAIVFSPLVKPEATRWLLAPGLVVLAMGLAVTPFTSGFVPMAIAVGLVAASAGILSPIAAYWISLGGGATQGEEIGRQTAAASLGQVVGSAVGGLFFAVAIMPGASFILTAGVVLAGIVASLGLPRLLVTQQRTSRTRPEAGGPGYV